MLKSDFLKLVKEPIPLVHAASAITLVSTMVLSLLIPWQFFYSVDAQDDEGEEKDIVTAGSNNGFTVIISENAAWSQSIDQRFNPVNIMIPIGAELTWINENESEHTVTSGIVAQSMNEFMMVDSTLAYLGQKIRSLTYLMNLEYTHIFVVHIHG